MPAEALRAVETVVVSDGVPHRLEDPSQATVAPAANGATRDVAADGFRYVILDEVGRGGMGTVHVAKDLELMRRVALKQLTLGASAGSARRRFLREVQITAQLDHPHVVPVYSLENAAGAPAYAMKLVDGRTFAAYLRETVGFYERGERPDEAHALAARLEHFLKVCDAVAYAHEKGVIHRDLKPANLMLGRHHEVYVMDWGICRVLAGTALDEDAVPSAVGPSAEPATAFGAVMGTPPYMSPEQASGRNEELDARSDQCALGLILFELVTLQRAYEGKTALEVLNHAASGSRRAVVHKYGDEIPRELVAIVNKATAARPADRYTDVRAMADDLRRAARGEAVLARPDTLGQRAQRWVARHRQAALVALFAILAAAALAVLGVFYVQEERLRAADLRERRMDALVADVTRRAHALETRFFTAQDDLESLAAAAGRLLEVGKETDRKFYWSRDFRDPARAPRHLVRDAAYAAPVSFEFGVWVPAPGAREVDLEPKIRRLMGLRVLRNDLFTRAREALGRKSSTIGTSAVHRLVVALEDGATWRFPGDAVVPDVYDGRSEPWYQLPADETRAVWGAPFVDRGDGAHVISVAQALVDESGAKLGVAALLFRVEEVARSLDEERVAIGASEALLIDHDGSVVASTRASRKSFAESARLREIVTEEIGAAETTSGIAAYTRLHPLDWTLVAVLPAAALD